MTDSEFEAASLAAGRWYIAHDFKWVCVAQSDNGIDDIRITHLPLIQIAPSQIVFHNGTAVGCYCLDHLFMFHDPDTHKSQFKRDLGYTGGWGDIYETDIYILTSAQ